MLRICRTRCVVQHLSIRNCSQSHRNALVDNAHVMSKMFSDNSARKRVRRRGINWNDWIAFCQPISAMFLTDPVKVMDKIGATGPLTTLLESVLRGDLQEEEKMQRFLFQAVLFPLFEKEQNEALNHARSSSVLDLRMPHEWYPAARAMQRRIVFHCGATNTGKVAPPSSEYSPMLRFFYLSYQIITQTFQALKRLAEAAPEEGGGLYCGPLRLLALEAFEKLNSSGAPTNLRTGQEIRDVPNATHISSTIEMVDLNKRYGVVVIDEIQMIADKGRGNNWLVLLSHIESNLFDFLSIFAQLQDKSSAGPSGVRNPPMWRPGGAAGGANASSFHTRTP